MTASQACNHSVSRGSPCCGSFRQQCFESLEFVNFSFETLSLLFLFCLGQLLIIFQRRNFTLQTLEFPCEALLFSLLRVSTRLVLVEILLVLIEVLLESFQIIVEVTQARLIAFQHYLSGLPIAF